MQSECNEIKQLMRRFTYFSTLKEDELDEGCSIAKMKNYKKGEIVYGGSVGFPNFVYFMISGACRMIESVRVSTEAIAGKIRYKLRNSENVRKTDLKSKSVFIEVCIVDEGGCFNLGEPMTNRKFVAVNDVRCMLLPMTWLWKKNTADIWSRIRHFVLTRIPPTSRVFEEFALKRRWSDYKANILAEIVGKKQATVPTTVADVPYSVKIYNR